MSNDANIIEQHVMFDIDGTLLASCAFDSLCFDEAVKEVLGIALKADRSHYQHMSDEGILRQHLSEHGIANEDVVIAEIKSRFIEKIRFYLHQYPAQMISGAQQVLLNLQKTPELSVSIATGGWSETALLKLASAGLSIEGIALASCNDHYQRCYIMQAAKHRAHVAENTKITYVGDGPWDARASAELGWNFILIGNKTTHHQQLPNFSDWSAFWQIINRHK